QGLGHGPLRRADTQQSSLRWPTLTPHYRHGRRRTTAVQVVGQRATTRKVAGISLKQISGTAKVGEEQSRFLTRDGYSLASDHQLHANSIWLDSVNMAGGRLRHDARLGAVAIV